MEPELIWMRYKKDGDEWQLTLYTGEMMESNGDDGNWQLHAPNKGDGHFFTPVDCSLRECAAECSQIFKFFKKVGQGDKKCTNCMDWLLNAFAPPMPPSKPKWNNQLAARGPPVTDLCCVIKGRHNHHSAIRGPALSLQGLPWAFSELQQPPDSLCEQWTKCLSNTQAHLVRETDVILSWDKGKKTRRMCRVLLSPQ